MKRIRTRNRPAQHHLPKLRMLPRGKWAPQPASRRSGFYADDARSILAPMYDSTAMPGGRSSQQWVAQYSTSHQHPVNRACHTLGIPTILLSLLLFAASPFVRCLWIYAAGLFVLGWVLQFIGHAFEGKEPEFFHDWRFLFVGVRWWWSKIRGRA
jgi:hypothetical protein